MGISTRARPGVMDKVEGGEGGGGGGEEEEEEEEGQEV